MSAQEGIDVIIESSMEYIEPPAGSNVAREIIRSFRDENARKIVLVDAKDDIGREFSGGDVWQQTARLATGLMKSSLQLKVGDRVLLLLQHCTREKFMALATLYTGACFIGCAPGGLDYVRDFCEPAKPRLIVTDIDQLNLVRRVQREVPGMGGAKIVLMDEQEGAREVKADDDFFSGPNLFDWPEIDEELIMQRVEHDINPREHYMTILMTSGSTGRSKLVPWTHERQLFDIWSIISANKCADDNGVSLLYPLGNKGLVLAGNNTLDVGPCTKMMLLCFIIGGKYVLIRYDDCKQFWRDVSTYKITKCVTGCGVTYKLLKQLIDWLRPDSDNQQQVIDISTLDYLACGGHRVNMDPLLNVLRPHYPHLNVTQYYGATEIGRIAWLSCQDARKSFDCLGKLCQRVSAKVVDVQTGKCLGMGKEGELLIKSPSLFDTYMPHPDESLDELMRDKKDEQGFYRTGDLVHYDEHERLYMHGRLKEYLCLEAGMKIWPSELEAIVNRHPLVESSVVVGIPNSELNGTVLPKAFVKLKTLEDAQQLLVGTHCESSPTTGPDRQLIHLIEKLKSGSYEQICDDILQFSKIDIDEEKHLTGGIRIVDDFPKTGAQQKLDRKALLQLH